MHLVRSLAVFALIAAASFAANAQQSAPQAPAPQETAPKVPAEANHPTASAQAISDSDLSLALCPIVYPVDQYSSDRGFHYIFYGNAFFINRDGYLLTAAHVLSQLSSSGTQPYIVLRRPMAPPSLLKVVIVAQDTDHDVALLRAEPNPFDSKYSVKFLAINPDRPTLAESVEAAALRPSRLRDPHTFDAFTEDRPAGPLISYDFSQLDKNFPETQLFLFQHAVLKGDSGAPVVTNDRQIAAAGLVEGQWLRFKPSLAATSAGGEPSGIGAVVPIHYAIALLQREGIDWLLANPAANPKASDTPQLLSAVPASMPSQTLAGGSVTLLGQIAVNGQLTNIQRMQGSSPFFENALAAVRTWSFVPGASANISITFEFAQTSAALRTRPIPIDDSARSPADHAAIYAAPMSPGEFSADNTVVALQIGAEGNLLSAQPVKGFPPLSSAANDYLLQQKFLPASCSGQPCASTIFLVLVSRHTPQLHAAASLRSSNK